MSVYNCGSFTERIGQYEISANNFIEDEDILVTVDVSALYTNIPQKDGIETCTQF